MHWRDYTTHTTARPRANKVDNTVYDSPSSVIMSRHNSKAVFIIIGLSNIVSIQTCSSFLFIFFNGKIAIAPKRSRPNSHFFDTRAQFPIAHMTLKPHGEPLLVIWSSWKMVLVFFSCTWAVVRTCRRICRRRGRILRRSR